MNSRILGKSSARPLFIDFDTYTDGDQDFKKELIVLIIDNLRELQQMLRPESHDIQLFHRVCHKIKATLVMLDDSEMLEIVEQLKIMTNYSQLDQLDRICADVIESLGKEE
jgi:hypothetical protein